MRLTFQKQRGLRTGMIENDLTRDSSHLPAGLKTKQLNFYSFTALTHLEGIKLIFLFVLLVRS